jgi:hypothetical protein
VADTTSDQERRDALERTIHHRLPACSEAELRWLDHWLTGLERERDSEVPWFIREPLPSIVRTVRIRQDGAGVLPDEWRFTSARHGFSAIVDGETTSSRCECGGWSSPNWNDTTWGEYLAHVEESRAAEMNKGPVR